MGKSTKYSVCRMCEEMSLTQDSDTWQVYEIGRLKIIKNVLIIQYYIWLEIITKGKIKYVLWQFFWCEQLGSLLNKTEFIEYYKIPYTYIWK